jgi:hypothetical protein
LPSPFSQPYKPPKDFLRTFSPPVRNSRLLSPKNFSKTEVKRNIEKSRISRNKWRGVGHVGHVGSFEEVMKGKERLSRGGNRIRKEMKQVDVICRNLFKVRFHFTTLCYSVFSQEFIALRFSKRF